MPSTDILTCEQLLRESGFRVTSTRVALLMCLKKGAAPLTVADMVKRMGPRVDKVTLYRALEDFTRTGIVHKVHLHDAVAHYEFRRTGDHHHHIVCEQCGVIEDIGHCEQESLQGEVLKNAKLFAQINTHSLEFFGLCRSCAA